MSATAKVIATPELLEVILLHLDLPSLLLRAPLVNKYFHHLIETSIAIQKTLFFISEPRLLPPSPHQSTTITTFTTNGNNTTTHNNNKKTRRQKIRTNPFLHKPFSLWFPQDPQSSSSSFTSSNHHPADGDHNNNHELNQEALPLHLAPPPPPQPQRHTIPTFLSLPSLTHPSRRAAIFHPNASWRRMLVQQPAPTKLGWISWGLDFSPEQGMVVPIVMKGVLGPFLGECWGADDGGRIKGKEWVCGGGGGGGADGGRGGLRMGELYDLTQGRVECFPRDFGGYAFRIIRVGSVSLSRSSGGEKVDGEEEEEEEGEEDVGDLDDELPLPQNRADQDTRALMREMGDDIEILFDERGYYPARVLGRAVGDVVESGEFRHPARQRIDVKLERADWPTAVAAG